MFINRLFILLFPLAFLAGGCQWLLPVEEEQVLVARAYENTLSLEEISAQVPANLKGNDSALLAMSLIENWIEKQVILHNARQNLEEQNAEIDRQVEAYRNDLLIYSYQSSLVNQKLDTSVTDQEIFDYYENNRDNFELKDYIVKVNYVQLDTNAPGIDRVKGWMESDEEEAFLNLEDYCHQFSVNYFLDETTWLYFDDLAGEIQFTETDKAELINRKDVIEIEQSGSIFLVQFKDYRLKDSISPLALERDNIKTIILNQRKQELISRMERDLYNRAQEKQEFEIYSL